MLTGSGRQELVWMDDLPLPPGQQTAYYVIYCHPRRAKIQKALDPENIVGRTHECRFRPLDLGGKFKVAFTITRIDRFGHEHVVAREVHAVWYYDLTFSLQISYEPQDCIYLSPFQARGL